MREQPRREKRAKRMTEGDEREEKGASLIALLFWWRSRHLDRVHAGLVFLWPNAERPDTEKTQNILSEYSISGVLLHFQ